MPSRLIQTDTHASGVAAFQVTGPAAAQVLVPEDVELAIIQLSHTDRYLDISNPAEPWTTSVSYFRPIAARRQGAAIWFEVDIGVTFHLETSKPYKVRIRQVEGLEAEEVFTTPAMRRPTRIPEDWKPPLAIDKAGRDENSKGPGKVEVQEENAQETEREEEEKNRKRKEQEEEESRKREEEEERKRKPQEDEDKRREDNRKPEKGHDKPRWPWLAAALMLVIAAGVGWYLTQGSTGSGAADAEPTLATIRADLARNPEPADARAKADALAKDGKLLDGQFLLYKYAGEKGDRDAARILGGFYDPATWSKETSPLPAPNPTEAARWLKQAAEAGDTEAQYRYAMLLKSGGTDEATGPEQAVVWLRRAADQGHEAARKELGP